MKNKTLWGFHDRFMTDLYSQQILTSLTSAKTYTFSIIVKIKTNCSIDVVLSNFFHEIWIDLNVKNVQPRKKNHTILKFIILRILYK
jgi:hypothetical protein